MVVSIKMEQETCIVVSVQSRRTEIAKCYLASCCSTAALMSEPASFYPPWKGVDPSGAGAGFSGLPPLYLS